MLVMITNIIDIVKTVMNPGWVGSLISLAGLIAALIIYRASRVCARPVFQTKAIRLLGKETPALPSDVKVFFKGDPVPRLTRVQIMFWNSGATILRGSDIVQDDPLRFSFEAPGAIIDASIVKLTREINKFAVAISKERPNELLCSFDYLDPSDGVTIDLLHTAELGRPVCRGSIRGVPAGVKDWGRHSIWDQRMVHLSTPF